MLFQYYVKQNLHIQSWTKGWRQTHKFKRNRFFYGKFYSWFFAFFTKKLRLRMNGWVHAIKPKHFRNFIEISKFPKIQSFKSFGNSWSNSYIHFLTLQFFRRQIFEILKMRHLLLILRKKKKNRKHACLTENIANKTSYFISKSVEYVSLIVS